MKLYFLLPGLIWGALFLSSCTQPAVQTEKPEVHIRTSYITGRFEGFPDYENWIVYLSGFNYRSVLHRVDGDGSFQIKAVNIPPGVYRLYFGKKSRKAQGFMRVKIDSGRTHLGIIRGD